MLKNYWKIAWRNLVRDRQFSLLNLLGLSVGLACALLIGLWVADEWRMEKYNPEDDRLFQVLSNFKTEDGIKTGAYTPGILAKTLKAELPEVEEASSVMPANWFGKGGVAAYGEKKLVARPQYVDSGFFTLFACPWLQGDQRGLFADKQGVALSSAFATALFGTTQGIIGKTIRYDHYEFTGDFVIRGVFEPNPANATEQFDLLFNYALVLQKRPGLNEWGNSDPDTYVRLRKGTDIAAEGRKISQIVRKYDKADDRTFVLAKFSDRYLYNRYENGVQSGGRIVYVRLFTLIAVFILIIGCINFMNLSTARAADRAREVGVRKVVGAGRRTLVLQYLGESILLTLVAMGLALAMVRLLLPVFNDITGKQLSIPVTLPLVLGVAGITLLTGLIAGSYPAFYLSAFRPVAVLKGKVRGTLGELWVRKGLVVFQFTLSVIFIAGVIVIYHQIAYIQSRDLGYSRDHIIHFSIPIEMDSAKIAADVAFIQELGNLPGVVNAASYSHTLMGDHGSIGGLQWPGKNPNTNIDFANIEVGYNFLKTAGIRLVAGRYFSQNANTMHEIILNETAIRAMGLKDPIGKWVHFWDENREIVGIARDFNFESLYQPVKPAFFRCYPLGPEVMVKLRAGSEEQTIAAVRKAYARFNRGMAFEYSYLDEDYQRLYAAEIRVGVLSRYFAGLAILISCLGLFGLAAFTAQRRKKEISIRKVVGGTTLRIAYLLSREFVLLVLVAMAIAFPLVALGMHRWLEQFAYRASIGYGVYWITFLSALGITLLAVGYQSIRAASMNPARNLRSE